ncbi:hypothetical protein SAMN05428952_103032 [Nitrosomonas sp. Nm132]|nr:hypothetical protein SAMN05428952_103032 [Nitrosomonas sp. Nm132]
MAFQSEDVAFGLFFIISSAAGNKIIKNITNANAEAICIQSISRLLPLPFIPL